MSPAIYLKSFQKNPSILKKLYQWRSDPKTVEYSFRNSLETFGNFEKNFSQKYHSIINFPPLLICQEAKPIGIIYFEEGHKEKELILSLYLDPQHQKKGLGTDALMLAQSELLNRGVQKVIAYVLDKNPAAQKAFEKAKFTKSSPIHIPKYGQEYLGYRYELSFTKKPQTTVIAEVGSNCCGGSSEEILELAKSYIKEAYSCGASVVKFQLFSNDRIYVPNAGKAPYLGKDINDIFVRYALPKSLLPKLYNYTQYIGIELMCSSFSKEDFQAVDPFVSRHKIASYEIRHLRLLELAAQSKKPLILSTGASTLQDIQWAKETFLKHGGQDLTLMHCIAQYPAKEQNLRCIQTLKEEFNVKVGLSDHSLHPLYAPIAAVSLGARVIEKHFTFSKKLKGPDHYFSVEPKELKEMCDAIYETEKILGVAKKEIFAQEEELATIARRGLQAIQKIEKGDQICEGKNVAILRCGSQRLGMHPKHLDEIEGKVAKKTLLVGEGLQKEDIIW